MISKKLLIFWSTLLWSSMLVSQQPTPNIVLIIADDMGIDITNGYQESNRMPTTPTLDSLRENGLMFSNTWAAPLCAPTRSAIMSGHYGIKTGVMQVPGNLDTSFESLFSKIKEASNSVYQGAVIGKWHISNPINFNHPAQLGVDHYEGVISGAVQDYYDWQKVEDGVLAEETEYVTTNFTNAAIDWVADQNQPWFLWLSHVAPHTPFHVPPADLFTVGNTNNNLGKYIAAIEAMDHEIGRFIASLDEATRENTVFIFIGDNGSPGQVVQNFPSNHSKGSLYEGGVRVPMIISGKGVTRINQQETIPCQVADLHATILALAGGDVVGGIHNSLSLKPLLICEGDLNRKFIYSDKNDDGLLGWAVRNGEYKLIEDEDGRLEFYKVSEDVLEEQNLIGNLSALEMDLLEEMQEEAQSIRSAWSCQDGIQNGDEIGIDDCDHNCAANDSLNSENIGCCDTPSEPSVFHEYVEGDKRKIYTNNFPDHDYCYNQNQIPTQLYHSYEIDLNPSFSGEILSLIRDNGRPFRFFGVAKNGVKFAPAPATPFIFEDQNTGEYNWDWVFEPTTNQGSGQGLVSLDCASAHTGPQGYHYHGNMFSYVDNLVAGLSSTTDLPNSPLHIGWASDGFPIVYKFGPDAEGNLKELLPSYQLKTGLRPGDGISAPCGAYNGKYTNDFEYICGKGDLDECNGIESEITIETTEGLQTFSYFYVITASFPQVSRCLKGNESLDFRNTAETLTGVDNDGDGYLSEFDCDDSDASINPSAVEIEGNDIDENCDGLLSNTLSVLQNGIILSQNPNDGNFNILLPVDNEVQLKIVTLDGKLIKTFNGRNEFSINGIERNIYILEFSFDNGSRVYKKVIVQ